jgi:hypothetical protein
MTHLDEGTVLIARDGGPVDPVVRSHLESCSTCEGAVAAAATRAEVIAQTLTALDGPIEATAAKAGVRARLQMDRGVSAPRTSAGKHLRRAAALLLVTAAAAAALPWSPVRSLWNPPAPAVNVDAPTETPVESTQESPAGNPSSAGITVAVLDGFVEVLVRGAAPGSEVAVTWTDEPTASLTAAPGSRFTYASGRAEVDASRGDVRIELPQDARVSLQVDGDLYLTGSRSTLEVLGPALERTAETIRFRVTER